VNDPALSPNYNREKAAQSIVGLDNNTRNGDLVVDPTIQKPTGVEDEDNMSLL